MRTRAGVSLIACCAMHVPRIMKSGAICIDDNKMMNIYVL